jgi:hypothetical protein
MKNLSFHAILTLSMFFVVSQANSQITIKQSKSTANKNCLEMQGIVKQSGSDEYSSEYVLDSAVVSVFNETKKTTDSSFSDKEGKCNINLPLNNEYMIRITKKGFLTKILKIDTRIKRHKKHRYVFPFDIDLFRKIEGVDVSYLLKDPIACVHFNSNEKYFDYNYNHTNLVNEKIRKVYADYYCSLASVPKSNASVEVTEPEKTPVRPIVITPNSNIVFKVQIVAVYFGPLPDNHPVFSKCGKAEESYSNGLFKYTIGEFKDTTSAQNKLTELKKQGYNDAFIVVFKNGIELPDEQAKNFLGN